MTEIEKLVCAETPTAREEIGTTMTTLRKPLKMWPGLYTILGPIRKLLDLDAPFEWGRSRAKPRHRQRNTFSKSSHHTQTASLTGGAAAVEPDTKKEI